MTFMAILGFSLVVTVLLVILRKERPEIAVLLGMAATGLILAGLLGNIGRVLAVFETLAIKSQMNLEYLKLIVKIVGLAYLAGFGAQICKDAGENGMAAKIELAGKIFILTMGIPIMVGLLDLILQLF
ncbi:MAG TPA: stage III sporulation protein AD [Bacillota bacterium]